MVTKKHCQPQKQLAQMDQKANRRDWQNRTQVLLSLVVLAATFCWYFCDVSAQSRAVQRIQEIGGDVILGNALGSRRGTKFGIWQSLTGRRVHQVIFARIPLQDSDLACLAPLRDLDTLIVQHSGLTDRGLDYIGKLKTLKSLDLSGGKVTDDGLAALKGLTDLEYLTLNLTPVRDEGLRHLEPMQKLRFLSVLRSGVTPKGVRTLKAAIPGLHVGYMDLNPIGAESAPGSTCRSSL